MVIEPGGRDTIVVRRVARDPKSAIGVFDGLYPAGYLDELRSRERA